MSESTEFFFLDEVARRFRVPVSTVRHWIVTGKLRSVRPGRRRLVRRDDLNRFCESFAAAAPAESRT